MTIYAPKFKATIETKTGVFEGLEGNTMVFRLDNGERMICPMSPCLMYIITTWGPDGLETTLETGDPLSAALTHCERRFAPNWPEPGQDWGCDPFGETFNLTTLGGLNGLEHYLGYRDTAIVVYRLLPSSDLERVLL